MALIYIVEDDPSIQEIEVMALKNSNYMVQAFDRASSLYDKLEEVVPNLILLDIMLPDEDGYKKKSFRISFCSTSCFLMRMVIKSCAD